MGSVHVEPVILSGVCARMYMSCVKYSVFNILGKALLESTEIDCCVFKICQPAEMKSSKFMDIHFLLVMWSLLKGYHGLICFVAYPYSTAGVTVLNS